MALLPSGKLTYSFPPITSMPDPIKEEPPPLSVPGWKDYDYQDYADLTYAIATGSTLEYALCQWLMRWEYNETVKEAAFPHGHWEDCYQYARAHCERFRKEQPGK